MSASIFKISQQVNAVLIVMACHNKASDIAKRSSRGCGDECTRKRLWVWG